MIGVASRAKGVLVLLHSEEGTSDVFRVQLLPDNTCTSVNHTIDNVPAATYSVSLYDLEEDGLPSRRPAFEFSGSVTVEGEGEGVFYI